MVRVRIGTIRFFLISVWVFFKSHTLANASVCKLKVFVMSVKTHHSLRCENLNIFYLDFLTVPFPDRLSLLPSDGPGKNWNNQVFFKFRCGFFLKVTR